MFNENNVPPRKGRIKIGHPCSQDHHFGKWAKISKHHDYTDRADTVFDCVPFGPIIEGVVPNRWVCTAYGFGMHNVHDGYGNGSVYVDGDGIEWLDEEKKEDNPFGPVTAEELGEPDKITWVPKKIGEECDQCHHYREMYHRASAKLRKAEERIRELEEEKRRFIVNRVKAIDILFDKE